MCGQYAIIKSRADLSAYFGILDPVPGGRDRTNHNVAPTQIVPIVRILRANP
jgi:putative SOS response-associated peptidase YedK